MPSGFESISALLEQGPGHPGQAQDPDLAQTRLEEAKQLLAQASEVSQNRDLILRACEILADCAQLDVTLNEPYKIGHVCQQNSLYTLKSIAKLRNLHVRGGAWCLLKDVSHATYWNRRILAYIVALYEKYDLAIGLLNTVLSRDPQEPFALKMKEDYESKLLIQQLLSSQGSN